jgi:hypothetical protein
MGDGDDSAHCGSSSAETSRKHRREEDDAFKVGCAPGSKRSALILAVGDYDHEVPLPNAIRDGETLKSALEQSNSGWEVDLVRNPTRSVARTSLYKFMDKCEGLDDVVLVAFIGHGGERYGSGYSHFILKDSKLSAGCAADSHEVHVETITTLEVCDMLKWPRSRSKYPPTIVIFDCCRTSLDVADGHRDKHAQLPSQNRSSEVGGGWPPQSYEFKNLSVIKSTNAGNVAFDGDKDGNGPFVKAFSKLIKEPGIQFSSFKIKLSNEVATEGGQLCGCYECMTVDFFLGQKPAPAPNIATDCNPVTKKAKQSDRQVKCMHSSSVCLLCLLI